MTVHEKKIQLLRMEYIERDAKSRLELTTKQELIKRLVREKRDYKNNKIMVGNIILKLLSKQLRGDLQVPEGMNNKYDSKNTLISDSILNCSNLCSCSATSAANSSLFTITSL